MPKHTCTIEGCDRLTHSRGWCQKHYLRWYKRGTTDLWQPSVCAVESCDKKAQAKGWCPAHYMRWRKNGDPLGGRWPKVVEPICSMDDCERATWCRGWCKAHYERWRKHGDPTINPNDPIPLDILFWSKVDRSDLHGCHPWTAFLDKKGYGRFTHNRKTYSAARLAYQLHYGVDPGDKHVCHTCDYPRCCNPAHLWLGTNRENIDDRVAKGRSADSSGEKSGNAKMTYATVAEMRRLRSEGWPQKDLAERYGIARSRVSEICAGKVWNKTP